MDPTATPTISDLSPLPINGATAAPTISIELAAPNPAPSP